MSIINLWLSLDSQVDVVYPFLSYFIRSRYFSLFDDYVRFTYLEFLYYD